MTEKAGQALESPRLNPNQFLATVSLVFNIGSGNFRASQIRQRLLRNDHDGAADIWWQWRRSGSDRRILPGLVKPREIERDVKSLQKFASVHASIHNHFNLDCHLNRRKICKLNRSAALAEWRQLAA